MVSWSSAYHRQDETFFFSFLQVRESRFRNAGMFLFGAIRNPRSSSGEESIRKSGIQAPLTRKAKKLIGIQYWGIGIHTEIQNSRLSWITLQVHGAISLTFSPPFELFLKLSFCWIVVRLIPVWGKFIPWNFQRSTGKCFGGKYGKEVHDHEVHLNVQVKFVFSWRVCTSDLFEKWFP